MEDHELDRATSEVRFKEIEKKKKKGRVMMYDVEMNELFLYRKQHFQADP